jgi:hypothetical protein
MPFRSGDEHRITSATPSRIAAQRLMNFEDVTF